MGDPAGVGPDVTVQALAQLPELAWTHRVLVIGHASALAAAADRAGLPWQPKLLSSPPWPEVPEVPEGVIALAAPAACPEPHDQPGQPSHEGALAQLAYIDAALTIVSAGQSEAMVTGPVSKIAITRTGIQFSGHTEHLAQGAGIDPQEVTMLFAGPRLRVALVTTHLPLAHVVPALKPERIGRTVARVAQAMRQWWRIERPRLVVLGINPHAGEEGLLGDEESRLVGPALTLASCQPGCHPVELSGPVPSEVGLRRTFGGDFDCAIAHYHDQATIACKLLEMGQSVNVTLGLPFLRTSVDHGVAYDAAAAGTADAGSMKAALTLAGHLTTAQEMPPG
jgi:4-hydroxythreonine-4-phosphate dehydrogenase